MRVGDKLWTNWNKAPMRLWQTQLNFAVFCASSACGVSLAHLNYTKHPMIRSVYRFHVYYHMRRVLKRLQVPLPHETGFNAADNPYTESEFFKICEDYRVPNDPMKYRDQKFYWTYQRGVGWPNDYIGPDSMTRWIIETSVGFTDVGLLRISESVRAYAYLILSSQVSARSSIVGNLASALTPRSAFLNNFEDIVNRKVNVSRAGGAGPTTPTLVGPKILSLWSEPCSFSVQVGPIIVRLRFFSNGRTNLDLLPPLLFTEDMKRYQDTLSYASSKVGYSVGQNIYMLPSNLKLKIKTGTVGYNYKIFVSDEKFILGKNDEVNLMTPTIKSHKTNSLETPPIKNTQTAVNSERTAEKTIISHEDEKVALVLSLTGIFTILFIFR